MAAVDVFRALGDPVRLEMMRRLSKSRSSSIVALSRNLGGTRQGTRRHLQVLVDAKLVRLSRSPKSGRDITVNLNAKTLDQAKTALLHLEHQWQLRLNALKNFVENDDLS